MIGTPREVEIEGGAGNDRYLALATDAPSRVDFDGGIGTDVANYFFATAGVHVSVDREAGDGRPGDDERIRRIDARDSAPDSIDCGGDTLDWAAVDIDAEASVTGCAEVVS